MNEHRLKVNQTGMIVLGSWAVGNIAVGLAGSLKSNGEAKYFHQMNLMWNVVNAGIAGFGLYSALNSSADLPLLESLGEHEKIKRILLFNAGLDVGYMAAGFYLRERSLRADNPERLRGFGNSLVLQGAFLFAFDLAMFFTHNSMSADFYGFELQPMGMVYRF